MRTLSIFSVCTVTLLSEIAFAQSRFTVSPYASVSSSKAIKPDKIGNAAASSETESVIQKTTYGLNIDIRLSSLFMFRLGGGTSQTDATKKTVALRDEFKEIDYQKDANVDPSRQNATWRKREQQDSARGEVFLTPHIGTFIMTKAGVGVRAMQRQITVTDVEKNTKKDIKTPIKYHAVGTAGAAVRLSHLLSAGLEYKFYFIKFPETEPHEQEVMATFGVSF